MLKTGSRVIAKKRTPTRENAISGMQLTIGYVLDTNDPQQMGRLRVQCPAWGDPVEILDDDMLQSIPWASYVAPLAGNTENLNRGNTDNKTTGPVAYGFWAIPKKGAQVVCGTIDGDHQFRVWLGCLFSQHTPHTMPHGRFLEAESASLSHTEQPISPLSGNLSKSFGADNKKYEWKTRAGDYSVSAVDPAIVTTDKSFTNSNIPDDKTSTKRQGYNKARYINKENRAFPNTGGQEYDSPVYSWTTPGFHAFSMDDRPENCRMKFRTTHGHQIIMDDTNERIYINTSEGNNWIELDRNGNIDIFSTRRVSIHSAKEMNFTTDETFRVTAKKGIHLHSDTEVRINSKGGDTHINSGANVRVKSTTGTFIQSGTSINIKSGTTFALQSTAAFTLKSDATLAFSDTVASLASGTFYGVDFKTPARALLNHTHVDAGNVNGGTGAPSVPAPAALDAGEKQSFLTARVPDHEPWNRVMMSLAADADANNIHIPELPYQDPSIGIVERGESTTRNPNWRR